MSEKEKTQEEPKELDSNRKAAVPEAKDGNGGKDREDKQEIPGAESKPLWKHIGIGLRLFGICILLCSVGYTALLLAMGGILWEDNARGSLVKKDGEVVGSRLIGQEFSSEEFFHPRPSSKGYDPMDSGSANLAPTNEALTERVEKHLTQLGKEGIEPSEVPVGWITESGSALDPHISPASANLQVERVSRETGLSEKKLKELIREHTNEKFFGLFGQPHVNVLLLNLDVKKAGEKTNE